MFKAYFTGILDAAHLFEMLFLAAAWTLLENKPWRDRQALICVLRDLPSLLVAYLLGDALLTGLVKKGFFLYSMAAHGAISAAYIFSHSRECSLAGLALWCSMYAGVLCLTATGGQCSYLLGFRGLHGSPEGLIRVLFSALAIPLAVYLNTKRLDRFDNIPRGGFAMILAGDFCLLLIRVMESVWPVSIYQQAVYLAAAYLCVFMLVLCAVNAIYSLCREQTRVLALTMENQRAASERELVRLTQRQLDVLHQLRHDTQNQLSYMHILLAQKRYDELEMYLVQQGNALRSAARPLDCGNRSVSIILHMERQKAEAAGVAFCTKLAVPPDLPFAEIDMCSILTNLIDNAIEECVRLGETSAMERGVQVSISPSGDYLYIEVRNPTDRRTLRRRENGLLSTKKDAAFHGYGTRIISRLVQKYNGHALYEIRGDEFTARVMLDRIGREEEAR